MSKKLTLLAALCIALALVSCGKTAGAPGGMKVCSNNEVDYFFYVPESWTLDLSTRAVSAYCSAADPSSISVMAWDLSEPLTLDDWWSAALTDFKLAFAAFDVTSELDTTLDGAPAKQYACTAKLGANEYRFLYTACISRSTVYLITYTSVPENYETHLDAVSDMTGYFRFK